MCGIFGYQGILTTEQEYKICASLKHRGPDAQRFEEIDKQFTLFHARLSIIDTVGGQQPFKGNSITLVFNGEIYNYKELIVQHQLQMCSSSDTEVIVRMYEKYGYDAFQYFHGMFAIGIFDHRTKKVLLARDRSGKKPLYFTTHSKFIFASEINSLLAAGASSAINSDRVKLHLQKGFVAGEQTVYEHINEVLPGHFYIFSLNGILESKHCYWSFIEQYKKVRIISNEKEALLAMDSALDQAVKKRVLSSDLEVGSFLSGGVDSSLVCYYAKKYNPKLRTFTVQSEGIYDESATAKAIASQLGTNHTNLKIDFSKIQDDYESIVSAYGEPIIDESIIPSYYVSQEAKKYLTVILNGDGGDEIMGGYRRHVLYRYYDFFQHWRYPITKLSNQFNIVDDKQSWKNYFQRLAVFLNSSDAQRYFSASTDLFYDAPGIMGLTDEPWLALQENIGNCRNELEKVLHLDFLGILPKILLKKMDIATMQHALEGRSPFLDTAVIETAMAIDINLKIKGTQTKYLLRKLLHQKISGNIYKLPKRGFEIPIKNLLDNHLKELLHDYLYQPNPYYIDILDYNYIKKYYLKPNSTVNEFKRYKGLFALLNLEIWKQSLGKK